MDLVLSVGEQTVARTVPIEVLVVDAPPEIVCPSCGATRDPPSFLHVHDVIACVACGDVRGTEAWTRAEPPWNHITVSLLRAGSTPPPLIPGGRVLLPNVEVLYHLQDHGRKGSALNQGVRRARSDILLFLDADVVLPPRAMLQALQLLYPPASYDIVSAPRRHEQLGWNVLAEPFLPRIGFPTPWFCMMFRSTFEKLRGWDDHYVEDVTMYLRVRELGLRVGYIQDRVRLKRRVRHEFRKGFALWRELVRRPAPGASRA